MGEKTGISWTHRTANFWLGCQKVSPGCEHCYAENDTPVRTHRAKGLELWGPPKTTERHRTKGAWKDVPKWDREAKRDGARIRVFVSSLADVFEDHPQVAPWRAEALALLASCTNLDVQLLTKRPQNVRAMVPPAWLTAWPAHIWIGCTVEDQKRAEERIPHLLRVPAAVRFLSCEPLLEELNLDPPMCPTCGGYEVALADDGATPCCPECGDEMAFGAWLDGCASAKQPGIAWVIVGGESGTGARPFAVEWAREIVRQCKAEHVPVFVKQMGDHAVTLSVPGVSPPHTRWSFRAHHGADPSEWPEDLRVQEFPATP